MKTPPRILLGISLVLLLLGTAMAAPTMRGKKTGGTPLLHEGDLLFQHLDGAQGEALRLATHSAWTHVGIALQNNGHWMVLEAVGPVKHTPLKEWIAQGGGHYVVKRLQGEALSPEAQDKLQTAAEPYLGKAYDWQFLWNDERIYCSELVWKLYEQGLGLRLCEPQLLEEFDLGNELVQRTMRERYGSAPPMDEPMVAPSTLFECTLLRTVHEQ